MERDSSRVINSEKGVMGLEITVMSLDFDSDDGIQTKRYAKPLLKIGRGADCDLVLKGDGIEAEHALLEVVDEGLAQTIQITDLGSASGTMVDNRPINANLPQRLRKNQRIMIGSYLIRPGIITELHSNGNGTGIAASGSPEIFEQPSISSVGRIIPKSGAQQVVEQEDPAYEAVIADVTVAEPEFALFTELAAKPVQQQVAKRPAATEHTDNGLSEHAAITKASNPSAKAGDVFETEFTVASDGINFDLEAQQLFRLRARVVHAEAPLPGVKFDCGALGQYTTDQSGAIEIASLTEGTKFSLLPVLNGYRISGEVSGGVIDRDLDLIFDAMKLCDIKGRITHRGQPLAGVIVDGGELGQVTTAADGSYCFTDVPEGSQFKLSVKKAGFVFRKQ